jgi:hypothetical protein
MVIFDEVGVFWGLHQNHVQNQFCVRKKRVLAILCFGVCDLAILCPVLGLLF